jgi:choline kinase
MIFVKNREKNNTIKENEMNIIITMGGLGSRFRKAGYHVPKYMIEAKGKTLFEWSLDSLLDYNVHVNKYVFIVRKEDDAASFITEKANGYGLHNIEIVELDFLTDGQATTAMLGIEKVPAHEAIMIYNIDTYVEPYILKYSDISGEGHMPCFHAEGEHWSFARLNEIGKVVEVREKMRISDNCTLGAYYFSSAELYKKIYNEYYVNNKNWEMNEKYVAPMYNYMIQKGYEVTISIIDYDKVHVLGTPEELEVFMKE